MKILNYLGRNIESTLLDIEKDLYNRQHIAAGISKNINKLRFSGYIRIKEKRKGNLTVYSLTKPLDELYFGEIDADYKKILDAEREIADIDKQMKLERSKV